MGISRRKVVALLRQALQQLHPVGFQLLVQQLLGARIVFDPDKAVAGLHEPRPFRPHLLCQPLPAIQSHLDLKGEPGLHPRIHPAEFRMDHIVIQHMTWTVAPHQKDMAVREGGVQFRAADRAHQAFLAHGLGRASATPKCCLCAAYWVEYAPKAALRPVLHPNHSARTVVAGPPWRFSILDSIPPPAHSGASQTIQNPYVDLWCSGLVQSVLSSPSRRPTSRNLGKPVPPRR